MRIGIGLSFFALLAVSGCGPGGATSCQNPAKADMLELGERGVLQYLIQERGQTIGNSMFENLKLDKSQVCGNKVLLKYMVRADDPDLTPTGGPQIYEIDLLTNHVASLDIGRDG